MSNLKNMKNSMRNVRDILYTPKILVDVIIKYLDKSKIIWAGFDDDNSEFVLTLRENGFNVINSHVDNGKDFFNYQPSHWDVFVSNPPFSLKEQVLERLYSFNKPFAVILGLPIINYQNIGNFFYNKDSDMQLLIVDKKVSFNGCTASFNNSYFCRNILPKDIIFEHLEHNNSGKNFIPSRMYKNKWCMYDWYINRINEMQNNNNVHNQHSLRTGSC